MDHRHRKERNMLNRTLFIILIIAIWNISAPAYKYSPPPLSSKSITGTWEGLSSDFNRYFRMQIDIGGPSYLVIASGMSGDLTTFVSCLQSLEVLQGKATILFKDQLKPITYIVDEMLYTTTGLIKVIASGEAGEPGGPLEETGYMDAEVILEPDSPNPTIYKLKFIKGKPSLAEWVNEASQAAIKSLEVGKGKYDQ